MQSIPGLYILDDNEKGRGVYTSVPVSTEDVIEICPVIVIPKKDLPMIHKTFIHDYYFLWGEDMEECAIALGYGSLYNHKVNPNADFILDIETRTIDIVAIRDIGSGEEITINYHGEPGNSEKLWF